MKPSGTLEQFIFIAVIGENRFKLIWIVRLLLWDPFSVPFGFMFGVWDGCSSLIWAITDNVIVFTTSHRLKAPPGAGCACAVSRCGCVRLLPLPCILKCLFEMHRTSVRTEGRRMPARSVNIVLSVVALFLDSSKKDSFTFVLYSYLEALILFVYSVLVVSFRTDRLVRSTIGATNYDLWMRLYKYLDWVWSVLVVSFIEQIV